MKKGKEEFYLVDLKVLPEAIKKTIKVKELLNDGICGSINEAVKKVDMSRSAYYKYKDFVLPFYEASITMTLQIEDASEPLSVLEDAVKSMKGIQSVVLQEAMLKAGE